MTCEQCGTEMIMMKVSSKPNYWECPNCGLKVTFEFT